MRAFSFSFASLLLVTACGDDKSGTPIDSKSVDAAPTFKGFDANEGGELRVEYVRRANGTAFTRVTSFLWKDPGSVDFYPFVNLNGCTDLRDKTKWPTASNPVDERMYMESGDVTIKGGPMDLVLPVRATPFPDPFGRVHPANTGHHRGPAMGETPNDAAMYLPAATALDVSYAGSADFPAQTFNDVIYMPQDFNVTNFTTGPVLIDAPTAAADMTFTFSTPAQTPPEGQVSSLVAFLGPAGPIVACIEPADGSITMPKELVAIAKATAPSGTLARQTLSHVVRELKDKDGNTGRRIDFVGVWCYAYQFTFQ